MTSSKDVKSIDDVKVGYFLQWVDGASDELCGGYVYFDEDLKELCVEFGTPIKPILDRGDHAWMLVSEGENVDQ